MTDPTDTTKVHYLILLRDLQCVDARADGKERRPWAAGVRRGT